MGAGCRGLCAPACGGSGTVRAGKSTRGTVKNSGRYPHQKQWLSAGEKHLLGMKSASADSAQLAALYT